jgi:hypothetical protein
MEGRLDSLLMIDRCAVDAGSVARSTLPRLQIAGKRDKEGSTVTLVLPRLPMPQPVGEYRCFTPVIAIERGRVIPVELNPIRKTFVGGVLVDFPVVELKTTDSTHPVELLKVGNWNCW